MKKLLLIFTVLSIASSFACSPKNKESVPETNMEEIVIIAPELTDICMPAWEQAWPVSKDGLYGKGQAHTEKRLAQNQDLADRRAREAITMSLKNATPTIITNFIQENSSISHGEITHFANKVSHIVLKQPLKGSYIMERYLCPNGTVYSLAFFPFANYSQEIIAVAQDEAKKNSSNKNIHNLFASEKQTTKLEKLIKQECVQ